MDAITAGIARQAGRILSIKEADGTVTIGPNASTYFTLVNITGRGQLFSVTFSPSTSGAKIRITIDGNTPLVVNDDLTTPLIYPRTSGGVITMYFNVPFDSSCLIEMASASAISVTMNVVWGDR